MDTDLYLYGQIIEMGGKNSSNIHLDTYEHRLVIVDIPRDVLEQQQNDKLYKSVGIHVSAKQHLKNGDILDNKAYFLDFVEYDKDYDESYKLEPIPHIHQAE